MKRLLILTFGTTVMLVCMLMLSREIYGNEIPKETIETGNASRIFVPSGTMCGSAEAAAFFRV